MFITHDLPITRDNFAGNKM